ncbi:hypothetical protein [Streptomyces sp. NPDC050145]|uniref:hypothetical protein n=1 Tax=Streptomyces sp. NPDC050145 TaxID=3365602 RepID=UPI0037B1DF67
MDPATLGAVGTILVGLATAVGALVGKRGENRATQSGALIGGYGALVDDVKEERDKAKAALAETELRLAEAYRELADARSDAAQLRAEITVLTAEVERLRALVAELGGSPT